MVAECGAIHAVLMHLAVAACCILQARQQPVPCLRDPHPPTTGSAATAKLVSRKHTCSHASARAATSCSETAGLLLLLLVLALMLVPVPLAGLIDVGYVTLSRATSTCSSCVNSASASKQLHTSLLLTCCTRAATATSWGHPSCRCHHQGSVTYLGVPAAAAASLLPFSLVRQLLGQHTTALGSSRATAGITRPAVHRPGCRPAC